jgi:hypothetical protein
MRFFVSGFFHQKTSPGPNRHAQEQFQIFSNIRGVIRVRDTAQENVMSARRETRLFLVVVNQPKI